MQRKAFDKAVFRDKNTELALRYYFFIHFSCVTSDDSCRHIKLGLNFVSV